MIANLATSQNWKKEKEKKNLDGPSANKNFQKQNFETPNECNNYQSDLQYTATT
jgi:hypothetical protein